MEKVKPPWRELGIVDEIGRVINTEPADDIAREGSEGMIKSHYFPGSLEAFETAYNEAFAEVCYHGFKFLHADSGEVRVERLSPLTVEVVSDSGKVRSLEVDDTVDETFISVCCTHGARHVKLIIVF